MIEAEREDQCAEPDVLRALRGCGEKNAWRRRKAERRLVMLRKVIAVEAGAVAGLQHGETIFVLHGELLAGAIHVIKDSEMHVRPAPSAGFGEGCCWAKL